MGKRGLEGYVRNGTDYCYCGRPMYAIGHQRWQCDLWRTTLPDESPGSPASWTPPMVLYDEAEDAGVSKGLELYLTFWTGRYAQALSALAERFPDQHRIYVACWHHDRAPAECARLIGRPLSTVRSWKHRAEGFMRRHMGDPVQWEQRPTPRLPETHDYDPSGPARRAEREELIRLNARKDSAA